ncbi:cytochrome P450 [Colletotrichum orchidophilum]|uniref:Cytochrome P450 n=1 Tax=Colletotrichum orchidophilum TaxID=1209926 RepID=A0A1G4BRS5_9PEZI|nr:cytochrome P450 [Colletotrichum orchidophilum]OHF04154.1 cytochrome P450 [Colletotrichum orchidophilum]
MTLLLSPVVIYALPVLVVCYIVSSFLARRRIVLFAETNGATFPKHFSSKLPLGIDYVWRALKVVRKGGDILDDVIGAKFAQNGDTFSNTGFFGPAEVYTIDPVNIQAILATKFRDFELGPRRIAQFKPLEGNNIFTADGAFWEHSRALFRPQFSRENINDLEGTERAVQALFRALPLVGKQAGDGALSVDIMPLLFRFTLDTSTGFLFGESVDSQMAAATGKTSTTSAATAMAADQAGSDMSFASAFHEAQMYIIMRVRLQGLYFLAPSGVGKKSIDYIRRYVDHYVQLALKRAKPSADKFSLLDTLVEHTRDRGELRDQILGLLLAGRDTTASLLSWVLMMLARHPAVLERLRAEVVEDFGEYTEKPEGIDFARLKASRYLQFVLRETLRLYNVVPLNSRIAARDTVLPRGGGADGTSPVVVLKGQTVNFSPYLLHRRADIWADAMEFKPERWEGVRLDWNYIPFSGGPRICLGQQFALTESAYLLVRLLQRFKSIEWVGPQGKPRKDIHFTMAPRDGVNVRIRYAES